MLVLANYFQFIDITLQRISETDIDATVALINDAYSYQDEAKGRPRINASELRKRTERSEFYVAKQDGRVVGCVYVERYPKKLHFGLLTVSSELRGKGLGPATMEAIENYARDLSMAVIELDYMSLAPWLKAYYEKLGYVETGEVTPWGAIDLVRMAKTL